jgi:glycosyltransferase involved in cell wall biosynthesis
MLTEPLATSSRGILHIAGWYPGPWSAIEGNFIQSHLQLFLREAAGSAIVVQVRTTAEEWLKLRLLALEDGVRGHYLLTRLRPGKVTEAISTLLLLFALLRARAWRFDALHFHIAYPLLVHVRLWKWLFRKPIIISEHWSAYHRNFNLPERSKALVALRRPFQHRFPVLAVSRALLDDVRRFAQRSDFAGYVIPNHVPLHGASEPGNRVPVFFCVSRWVEIKNPMPMLAGMAEAATSGARFELVIGGFGDLIEPMKAFVATSILADRTRFTGSMTKTEIAAQLGRSDGYIFSSLYETFSVACAEALGAGVPLIGPQIPAIAEYAGNGDWEMVETRTADGWARATTSLLQRISAGDFDRRAIAARAAKRFSPEAIRAAYRQVLDDVLVTGSKRKKGRHR